MVRDNFELCWREQWLETILNSADETPARDHSSADEDDGQRKFWTLLTRTKARDSFELCWRGQWLETILNSAEEDIG